jgi:hypothetical protein
MQMKRRGIETETQIVLQGDSNAARIDLPFLNQMKTVERI